MPLQLALALARGLHMAGSYGLFGTILLAALFLPHGATLALRRLAWGSLCVALAAGIAWFLLQSADMASASNFSDLSAALPIVAESTRFGNLLLLRLLLAVIAILCLQTGFIRIALVISGLMIVAQAWLGHGGAMTGTVGTVLLIASIFHLAGGAAWIGSLPGLFVTIAGLPQAAAAQFAKRYSPFGIACVAALLLSAATQFCFLISPPAALFTTLYGRVALLKILLLAGLILLAAMNRYRLAPGLAGNGSKTGILASIGLEIILGLTAILAAGWLLNLTPPSMAAMLARQQ